MTEWLIVLLAASVVMNLYQSHMYSGLLKEWHRLDDVLTRALELLDALVPKEET